MSHWESLFDQSVSIINQANSHFKLLDSWTFGGGTALMLQIDHRESFDIDIFIDDPQVLPYLNPTTQGYSLQLNPDEYVSDGTHAFEMGAHTMHPLLRNFPQWPRAIKPEIADI